MKNNSKQSDLILLCKIIIFLALNGIIPAYAANMPDSKELIEKLGIDSKALTDLDKGEAIPFNIGENTKKELAAGVAIFLPSTPSKIIEVIRNGNLASIESDIISSGIISSGNALASFKGFGFSSKQSKEAEKFLMAEAGEEFNLSNQEIEEIKAIKPGAGGAARETASQVYRDILLHRWEAYRKSGLKGISTYMRKGDAADPAAELRDATQNSKVLASYFPDLHNAWLNYPSALPANAEEQFLWLNLKVEKRPTPILVHRVMLNEANSGVILARQFYVGHSYNSSQLTVGCLPYRDGSLLFYATRTSTDQVAGMGSSLKHSIGREQMRSQIIKRLKKLKQLLKAGK